MKRTNIVLDEKLIAQGLRISGLKTRRALFDHLLSEYVRRDRIAKMARALRGKIRWEGNIDQMRRNRIS